MSNGLPEDGGVADPPAGRMVQAARGGDFERTVEHLRRLHGHLCYERTQLRLGKSLCHVSQQTGLHLDDLAEWMAALDRAIEELRKRD